MTTFELLTYLRTIAFQLTELNQYSKYQQLCKDAKKAGYPSIEEALNAILYAIDWAESSE